MRLVILCDSLGRPRPDLRDERERTRYHQVYGRLLAEYLGSAWDVELCYVESLDSADALFWSQRMVAFREPDAVIFHFGINDCGPRVFRKNSRSILLVPWFRRLTRDCFMRLIGRLRPFLTRWLRRVYVTEAEFRRNFLAIRAEIEKYSPKVEMWAVGICSVNAEMNRRSFGFNRNIERYNRVLKEIFSINYVDPQELLPSRELLISDGIHLSEAGHAALAAKLRECLRPNDKALT